MIVWLNDWQANHFIMLVIYLSFLEKQRSSIIKGIEKISKFQELFYTKNKRLNYNFFTQINFTLVTFVKLGKKIQVGTMLRAKWEVLMSWVGHVICIFFWHGKVRSHMINRKFHKNYNFPKSRKYLSCLVSHWFKKMKEVVLSNKFYFSQSMESCLPNPLR